MVDWKITLKKIGTISAIVVLTGLITVLSGTEVPVELIPYVILVPLLTGILDWIKHKDD